MALFNFNSLDFIAGAPKLFDFVNELYIHCTAAVTKSILWPGYRIIEGLVIYHSMT